MLGLMLVVLLAVPAHASAGRALTGACQTVFCGGLSSDGSKAVFPFAEQLTSGADRNQLYEWVAGTVRPLIPRAAGPAEATVGLVGVSADAAHVFVTTNASLVAEDFEQNVPDLYDLNGGGATLLSTGSLDQPQAGATLIRFAGASENGLRVFFDGSGPLVPGDGDGCPNLYERSGGQTRLVAPGPPRPPGSPLCTWADFGGISADGTHVFVETGQSLVSEDKMGTDIYQDVGGVLTLLTTYPEGEGGCVDTPKFGGASANGATVLFSTGVRISSEDTDSAYDVYKREPDGSFTLVSRGTDGGVGPCDFGGDRPVALSADGRTAIFETRLSLSSEDRDISNDLYSSDGSGAISLLTTGPTDPQLDEHSIVFPDWLTKVSDDASHVAFESTQRLVAADTDRAVDVYLRAGGQTELVSVGPLGGNAGDRVELHGISGDGQAILFTTEERLLRKDLDFEKDVYLRWVQAKRTVLLSDEEIAPRMGIAQRGKLLRSGRIAISLGCPKKEASGPCHGELKLNARRRGRAIGSAKFEIARGKRELVAVRTRRQIPRSRHSIFATARGLDRLGNGATATRRVTLVTGAPSPKSSGHR
jgi:hypothetical protein